MIPSFEFGLGSLDKNWSRLGCKVMIGKDRFVSLRIDKTRLRGKMMRRYRFERREEGQLVEDGFGEG